jgi:hypothetical protein
MITLHESLTVSRPAPDVFDLLADFTAAAEWDPGIRSSRLVSGDGGVGSRYEVEATFAGRVVPMTYQVVERVHPERIVLVAEAARVNARDEIGVEDLDGLTRVTYHAEFTLKGGMRYAEFLLRPLFGRLGRKAMDGLDRFLN